MTLVEFLLARIAEDEAVARAATPGSWHWAPPSGDEFPTSDESLVSDGRIEDGAPADVLYGWGYDASGIEGDPADREHIARHDPARVLADCEARRRIVELHTGNHECVAVRHGHISTVLVEPGYAYEVDPTLRLLALPYTAHPDYDEVWRP